MYTLIEQKEEDFQQLTGIEKEKSSHLTVPQEGIKQVIEGFNGNNYTIKKANNHIEGKEVELLGRKGIWLRA